MSELKLFTAWQKLAGGPARVQVKPTSEIQFSLSPPEVRDHQWSSFSGARVLGGETEEIEVPEGKTLSIRLACRIDVVALVDLPALADPELPPAA
ncbi:hypothetical protein P7D22_04745 [Lichenihabitans sp. Uapishka_5]|uniref:hypothetical protein n=1 Tax=Lichenihabitans sp. Uapishka_5 TaxID=3037302 RepID=UPI0029E7E1C0|nr:hypothetical protein [Lichenihabitans sp. Uapishka_5]MDX7950487.1 hypothetical protein [Lichenihabitans sp. Uapishka_5]